MEIPNNYAAIMKVLANFKIKKGPSKYIEAQVKYSTQK
jgi:hypothetical protein